MSETETTLTVPEAAEALRVCNATVRAFIRRGLLHATRLPGKQGRFRIHRDDLLLAMERGRGQDASGPTRTGA